MLLYRFCFILLCGIAVLLCNAAMAHLFTARLHSFGVIASAMNMVARAYVNFLQNLSLVML